MDDSIRDGPDFIWPMTGGTSVRLSDPKPSSFPAKPFIGTATQATKETSASPAAVATGSEIEKLELIVLVEHPRFELERRNDKKGKVSVELPEHLKDRAKDFPEDVPMFRDLTPLGQANVLILQLADRVHRLEERIKRLERSCPEEREEGSAFAKSDST